MALPYTLIDASAPAIGLIVLQADETLERDMRQMLPDDTPYLVSRIASAPAVSSAALRDMEGRLTSAAALFPEGKRLSAVGYGCTSAVAEIGADRVGALISKGTDTAAVTDPVTALIAACRHLGLTRIGLISPYVASVSDRLRDVLDAAGIKVMAFDSFDEPLEAHVARIAPDAISDAACAMGSRPDCDAVFLSCTNLRTFDVIAAIEAKIAKPVLSSNQVLGWHLCQLAGVPIHQETLGRLCR
ncbi:maleate cis-trans isomerase family protein [Yoonia sp. 208BN28-4]|uniref:maleate cis-trans isomerase family protein n=1 Tax=Yoonia sp. 208BN28-4 TaxID=3126505 RepID=UPI003097E786